MTLSWPSLELSIAQPIPDVRVVATKPSELRNQSIIIEISTREPAVTRTGIELTTSMHNPAILKHDTLTRLQLQFERVCFVFHNADKEFKGVYEMLVPPVTPCYRLGVHRTLERRGVVDALHAVGDTGKAEPSFNYRPSVMVHGAFVVIFVVQLSIGEDFEVIRSNFGKDPGSANGVGE